MRIFALLPLLALAQDKVDAKLDLKRHDSYTLAFAVDTNATSSNGRDEVYTLALELKVECDEASGGVMKCGAYLQSIKAKGKWRGNDFEYDWKKGGTAKTSGAKLPGTIQTACDKGFKVTLTDRGVVTLGDDARELLDVFPIWNPSALVGLASPMDPKAGTVWSSKGHKYEYCGHFAADFQAAVGEVKDGAATISAAVKLKPLEDEVPIDGGMTVKGEVDAKATWDTKTNRPVKGEYSAKVHVAQGGWKREFAQKATFEVKK
jgi:hypothetical protein